MANVFICELTGAHGWPFPVAAGLLLLIAAVVGAFNGFVSKRFTIHPLLITIGTGAILTGLVRAIGPNGGRATAAPPAWLQAFTSPNERTGFVPLPPVVLLWLLAAILIGLLLTRTSFGRQLYATGSNPRAADLARINTTAVWMRAFALSSIFAAITGIMLAGFADQGSMTMGDPFLFQTIVCVVLGGTTLQGGRGDYWRTVLGTLIFTQFTLLFNGLNVDFDNAPDPARDRHDGRCGRIWPRGARAESDLDASRRQRGNAATMPTHGRTPGQSRWQEVQNGIDSFVMYSKDGVRSPWQM